MVTAGESIYSLKRSRWRLLVHSIATMIFVLLPLTSTCSRSRLPLALVFRYSRSPLLVAFLVVYLIAFIHVYILTTFANDVGLDLVAELELPIPTSHFGLTNLSDCCVLPRPAFYVSATFVSSLLGYHHNLERVLS